MQCGVSWVVTALLPSFCYCRLDRWLWRLACQFTGVYPLPFPSHCHCRMYRHWCVNSLLLQSHRHCSLCGVVVQVGLSSFYSRYVSHCWLVGYYLQTCYIISYFIFYFPSYPVVIKWFLVHSVISSAVCDFSCILWLLRFFLHASVGYSFQSCHHLMCSTHFCYLGISFLSSLVFPYFSTVFFYILYSNFWFFFVIYGILL